MIARTLFTENKKLRVFDLDDTLIKTNSFVTVIHKGGKRTKLSPGEYAIYRPTSGDTFDYSDFNELIEPKEIKAITKILRRMSSAGGSRGVYILTARSNATPIIRYIKDIGLRGVNVVALGDSNPEKKADWIEDKVQKEKYNDVYFIDDSLDNVRAVKKRVDGIGVKNRIVHMKSKWEESVLSEWAYF